MLLQFGCAAQLELLPCLLLSKLKIAEDALCVICEAVVCICSMVMACLYIAVRNGIFNFIKHGLGF
jgi:hypothetical protein